MQLPADLQSSPKAATLLREPLLRDSAQRVTVRMSVSRDRLRSPAKQPAPGSPSSDEDAAPSPPRPSLLEVVRTLRGLPREVGTVLLIDLLNSYRSFGFRSVQYQYLVNDFHLSDMDTASLLGVQAWLLTHNTRKPS